MSGALIPNRDPSATTGSVFISNNINLTGSPRDNNILNEFLSGNIPDFLRNFKEITISDNNNTITYLVMSDVLCIGSNDDYVRMPMSPLTAQKIADKYDCTLPTVKMTKDIWSYAINKLTPLPWGPPFNEDMILTYRIGAHNTRINVQLISHDINALTAGHKKDVCLTNKLGVNNPNKKVAIVGWYQLDGSPIQPLNPVSHDENYYDYSHGIRLIANDVMVNGNTMRMQDVFKDPTFSKLVSDEGPMLFIKY
jgi:predicted RNA-binding protein